ncbi:twin-arginine translocation signal domain-containing protein [Sinorhizobium meliloti]|nr:twin-arginine translocation signal domain-containing protein [Sinorhizobium meliloti]
MKVVNKSREYNDLTRRRLLYTTAVLGIGATAGTSLLPTCCPDAHQRR